MLWQKFTPFESEKSLFGHFLETVSPKWVDKMPIGLEANFVSAGSLSKNISLLRDVKYMGACFVAVGILYSRDFIVARFDCV